MSIVLDELPYVAFHARKGLPTAAGIYFALTADGTPLYVGRAVNIANRWSNHHRAKQLSRLNCARLAWLLVDEVEMLGDVETEMIRHFTPQLNGTSVEDQDFVTIIVRMDRETVEQLDALLQELSGPYKAISRNSFAHVAIRDHLEKLRAMTTPYTPDAPRVPDAPAEGQSGGEG